MDLVQTIEQAKIQLLENNLSEVYKILKPLKKSLQNENSNNLELNQIFMEYYLENNQIDKAYPLLVKSCELDPLGEKGGNDKFFTLGQIIGSREGLELILKGIENEYSNLKEDGSGIKKIISAFLSMIEIWMTDLCMEEDAENQCEEIIKQAIEVSNGNSGEVWSMLGSIRISQQRYKEAMEAFQKSWELFELKKNDIEERMKTENCREEYNELVQPLINLCKMCIEMCLYEESFKIIQNLKDIEEDNLEVYYLEGFLNYIFMKLMKFKKLNQLEIDPENVYQFNEHFKDLKIESNEMIEYQENVNELQIAFSFVIQMGKQKLNGEEGDEIINELIMGSQECLNELNLSIIDMQELSMIRKGHDEDENVNIELEKIEFE
ncbi:hypothetical protein TBLA_0H01170 [Henningerozyma blattae CBS 6284]|uniref:Uncharacterized protein n=1 Tax=Henningerozyma blattae (strain ATCC 34711 / CBS 6284 / DSM 70876 / NBRC 10599 / NRRL Y-10934 / UCD 77-7) TaxID=1071380 RepID=I2H7Q3_HENB6|nr:hypothetical protein TBLA_0H01170 [Tetrapisispora blattae CBS 6284]CCH62405.1 hypothetical protein TBLA_0H01170 [Tetrapisispora blattae CBS 6284]